MTNALKISLKNMFEIMNFDCVNSINASRRRRYYNQVSRLSTSVATLNFKYATIS